MCAKIKSKNKIKVQNHSSSLSNNEIFFSLCAASLRPLKPFPSVILTHPGKSNWVDTKGTQIGLCHGQGFLPRWLNNRHMQYRTTRCRTRCRSNSPSQPERHASAKNQWWAAAHLCQRTLLQYGRSVPKADVMVPLPQMALWLYATLAAPLAPWARALRAPADC